MKIQTLLSFLSLGACVALTACDEQGAQGGMCESDSLGGGGKSDDSKDGSGMDDGGMDDDMGGQSPDLMELTAAINGALDGATPLRIEHYCNNGDNDSVPVQMDPVPIGCRTVIFFQDEDGVPLLDNDDPTDDIILDGFASGERQVCANAWFYRNGGTLDNGESAWTAAVDGTCDGLDNVVIDLVPEGNENIELTFDNADNDIPFTIPGISVQTLNPDGSLTARMSTFHFTDSEVSLQNFEGPDEDNLELVLDRHYWHAELDDLP